jgi:flavin reductase (DIM6/NTAB) family NADH-FMN oxidoreductase RutF
MEFTINLPSKDLVKQVDFCGVRSGRQVDKIKDMGFTLEDASIVNAPIIKQCPVALECRVKNIIPLGSHDLFLAEVVAIQVEGRLMDANEKIHLENADLISYSHGEYFPLDNKAIGKFGFSVMKKVKKGKPGK